MPYVPHPHFSASEASRSPERASNTARLAEHRAAENAARVTEAANETAQRGEEVLRDGMLKFAELHTPFVDASQDHGRRVLETTTRVIDAYRRAAESTAEDVQALVNSYSQLGRGIQQWQRAYFELLQRSMERASDKRQALVRCGSPAEFAELQQQLYRDAVSSMIEGSTHLLQLTGQIAQEAARPLQGRANGAHA